MVIEKVSYYIFGFITFLAGMGVRLSDELKFSPKLLSRIVEELGNSQVHIDSGPTRTQSFARFC